MTKSSSEEKFWRVLENLYAGAEPEGKSGYVNLIRQKRRFFANFLKPKLREYIDKRLSPFPEFKEELYRKLYTFFEPYFSETGSVFFVKSYVYYRQYERIYGKEDIKLFWKTKDLYYLKSDLIVKSMEIRLDEDYTFYFDASEIEHKKSNEKRKLIYSFQGLDDKGRILLKVEYSERGRETKEETIIKAVKRSFKERGLKALAENFSSEHLNRAMKTFERQTKADYFIHKDPERFLKEQFNLWLFQYFIAGEEETLPPERINQLMALKDIAYRVIEMVAGFEEEIKRLWEKPRFTFNSNYVVSLDRIAEKRGGIELIERIIDHPNFQDQLREWRDLGILKENIGREDILVESLHGKELNPKYRFLPIDTKHFKDMEAEIVELFDLDEELDGLLIKSENWQALNTLLPRFRGKVQTVYIDPPFNKGESADYFYEVDYKDATWATMLENRLSVAKEFLKEEGSIFVRCDYNGNWIVRALMNEIFGEENFRNEILINRKRQAIGTPGKFETESEYLYLFSQSERFFRRDLYRRRSVANLKWTGFLKQEERNPPERVFFGKVLLPPPGQHFALVQDKVDKLLREHYIRLRCRECKAIYYWDEEERGEGFVDYVFKSKERFKFFDLSVDTKVYGVKRLDRCLSCGADNWKVEYLTSDEEKITDNWKDIPSYSDKWGFKTENSEILLKRVLESTSNEGDWVLDFFLGSGTTIAVAHKLRRRWIGIEMGEHFHTVILPRMKRVLAYDGTGVSKEKDVREIYNEKRAGGFFKYYELEQFEDILRSVEYTDVEAKEFYEKLLENDKELSFSRVSPFLFDRKLAKAVEIDEGRWNIDLGKLYPEREVDIVESLVNALGLSYRSAKEKLKSEGSSVLRTLLLV